MGSKKKKKKAILHIITVIGGFWKQPRKQLTKRNNHEIENTITIKKGERCGQGVN